MDRDIEERFEHFHEWKRKIEGDLNGSGFEKQGIFSKLKSLEGECAKMDQLKERIGVIDGKANKANARIDDIEQDEQKDEKKSGRLWERLAIIATVIGVVWALVRG